MVSDCLTASGDKTASLTADDRRMTLAQGFPGLAGDPVESRGGGDAGLVTAIARMTAAAGLPALRLIADIAALAAGPGRISIADYERLRLYDERFWERADRREVAGRARARRLVGAANFRADWRGLATDRIAWGAYLAAHGLPVAPMLAVYREGLAGGPGLLRTRDELRDFLTGEAGRPLVALPADGGPPRRLWARDEADAGGAIDRLIEDVADRPNLSWLVQPLLRGHPQAPCGAAGAAMPVRVLTLAGAQGAKVARAYWPLGGPREAVASLELRTGAANAVFAAASPERARAPPKGLEAPDWARLKAVAVEAARAMTAFGLISWEIAPTEEGPVIVGLDPAPDLDLFQLADRQGLLTPELGAFLAERRRRRADRVGA